MSEKTTPTPTDVFKEKEAEVQTRLKRIAALRAEETDLHGYLKETHGDLLIRIDTLTKEKERIEGEIALYTSQMKEADPEAYTQLGQIAADIKKLEEQVKSICHALPVEVLKTGKQISGSGFKVTVSKATTHREFKVVELLQAHPEYFDLAVEGDKLVRPSIDVGVLDRLIAMGTINEEDVKPFVVVVKDKSPSVSIAPLDVDLKS